MKWTVKQKRFKKEYLVDFNSTRAAIRSGYSEKTAYSQGQRLLKVVEMQEAMQKESQKHSDKVDISIDNVLKDLIDTRAICSQYMVKTDDKGVESLDTAAVNGRTKANELLGKYQKMFTDKVELSGKVDGDISYRELTNKQLSDAIAEKEKLLKK